MNNKSYHIFFSKLSNKLRIDIISSLSKSPKTVSQLVTELKQEQSKISHALKALSTCKIVQSMKDGKNKIYRLSKTIKPILKLIEEHEKSCCKSCICGCLK